MENKSLVEVKLISRHDIYGRLNNPGSRAGKLTSIVGVTPIKKNKAVEITCLFDKNIKADQEFELLNMKGVDLPTYTSNGYEYTFHALTEVLVLKVKTKL